MLTQQKIDAVKKQLRSGIPEGELKNELRDQGYTEDEISLLFKPRPYDMRSWYLVSAVILLAAGLYTFAKSQDLLLLFLAAVMFTVYYREYQKQKKIG